MPEASWEAMSEAVRVVYSAKGRSSARSRVDGGKEGCEELMTRAMPALVMGWLRV